VEAYVRAHDNDGGASARYSRIRRVFREEFPTRGKWPIPMEDASCGIGAHRPSDVTQVTDWTCFSAYDNADVGFASLKSSSRRLKRTPPEAKKLAL